MSQTTLYGLIAGLALVMAGAALMWKGEQVTGGLLIAAGLGALGLGKTASDAPKAAVLMPLFLISLFLAGPARAQDVALTNLSLRAHVTANAGALALTNANGWRGATLGGKVVYNLHPRLSAVAAYDHGFPVRGEDSPLNLVRAVGSLRLTPYAFAGFGYAWFDQHMQGAIAQLEVTKKIMPRLGLSGVYAHVFPRAQGAEFEYVRAFVTYHVLGKE